MKDRRRRAILGVICALICILSLVGYVFSSGTKTSSAGDVKASILANHVSQTGAVKCRIVHIFKTTDYGIHCLKRWYYWYQLWQLYHFHGIRLTENNERTS